MSENKQYIVSHNGKEDGILDKTNDKGYYGFELARLVNELSEENEQLKKDLKKKFIPFAKTNEDYTAVNTEKFIKILNENEQLRQELNNFRQVYFESEEGVIIIQEILHEHKEHLMECKRHDEPTSYWIGALDCLEYISEQLGVELE